MDILNQYQKAAEEFALEYDVTNHYSNYRISNDDKR